MAARVVILQIGRQGQRGLTGPSVFSTEAEDIAGTRDDVSSSPLGVVRTIAARKGAANGLAGLDGNARVPLAQLPDGLGGEGGVLPENLYGEEDEVWVDLQGIKILAINRDGSVYIQALEVGALTGQVSALDRKGINLRFDAEYWPIYGQSLAVNAVPPEPLTTEQEYNNVGLPPSNSGTEVGSVPTTLLALTAENCSKKTGDVPAENPMFGMCGGLRALIDQFAGGVSDQSFQLCTATTAVSGYQIEQLDEDIEGVETAVAYGNMLIAAQAASDLLTESGRTPGCRALTFIQGVSDRSDAVATYLGYLRNLIADVNEDLKAIFDQDDPIRFFGYQTSYSEWGGSAPDDIWNVQQAQFEASRALPLYYTAASSLGLPHGDKVHLDKVGSRLLGEYVAIARFFVIEMGMWDWLPLVPVSHSVRGTDVILHFRPWSLGGGLEWDTSTIAAQGNYGFGARDGSGAVVAINTPEIVGPNTVRIPFQSAIPSECYLRLGVPTATALSSANDEYAGVLHNLRDRQGDVIKRTVDGNVYRMDNWALIFKQYRI